MSKGRFAPSLPVFFPPRFLALPVSYGAAVGAIIGLHVSPMPTVVGLCPLAQHPPVSWTVPALPVFLLLLAFLALPVTFGGATSASTPLVCVADVYDCRALC